MREKIKPAVSADMWRLIFEAQNFVEGKKKRIADIPFIPAIYTGMIQNARPPMRMSVATKGGVIAASLSMKYTARNILGVDWGFIRYLIATLPAKKANHIRSLFAP